MLEYLLKFENFLKMEIIMLNKRDKLNNIIQKIEDARMSVSEHNIVKFVAVSKYSTSSDIKEVFDIGHRAFGENKVQDYIKKRDELDDIPIEWHFIGSLQKNKINKIIDNKPFLLHSLDSLELAEALNVRLEAKDSFINALVQVNSSKEKTKSGFMSEEISDVYLEIQKTCPRIRLKGLMSIGAYSNDVKKIQESFEITKRLFDDLKCDNAKICSMGMSGDYELAIKCGANLLRIGSGVFA
jgi:pyridoxal phosphate enzyme (YggS family)